MSLVANGRRWRYSLQAGGVEERQLGERDLRALALDARLHRRLSVVSETELAWLNQTLARALRDAAEPRDATEAWVAGDGERLLPAAESGRNRLIGVSPIGEYVPLWDSEGPLGSEGLGARVLRWGSGRVAAHLEPVQMAVLPAIAAATAAARTLADDWGRDGLRVELIADETLGRRLRRCWYRQIPYLVVVAPQEVAAGKVEWRQRGQRHGVMVPAASIPELTFR